MDRVGRVSLAHAAAAEAAEIVSVEQVGAIVLAEHEPLGDRQIGRSKLVPPKSASLAIMRVS